MTRGFHNFEFCTIFFNGFVEQGSIKLIKSESNDMLHLNHYMSEN